MRLLRLHLTDFAGVRDREVAFAPQGVTVLVGPNEAGKSTLLTALDLLLDMPDSSHHRDVLAVQPVGRDVGPSVEAELLAGPYRWIYAKRWLQSPQTTLRVEGPGGTETRTGREAHDRAQALFRATVDETLWAALRVQQGQLSQVSLAGSPSLRAALDEAAGGGMGGREEDSLLGRAGAERARYLTERGGRPTGPYKAALEDLERARQAVAELQATREAIERLLAEIPRLTAEVVQLEGERAHAAERLRELRATHTRLQEQAADVSRLQAEALRAEHAHRDAVNRLQERRARIAGAEDAAQGLARLRQQWENGPDLAGLRAELEKARQALEGCQAALAGATEARKRANAQWATLRTLEALRDLEGRLARASDLRNRRMAAEAVLAAIPLTAEGLAALEQAQDAHHRASARLEVGGARLSLTAAQPLDLTVGAKSIRLAPGEAAEWSVPDGLEVVVPDVLAVRVRAGNAAASLREAAGKARAQLEHLLAAAGVDSVPAARGALQRRREAELTLDAVEKDLAALLGEETWEALAERRDRLAERCKAEDPGRQVDQAAPTSLPDAEARARAAEEAEGLAQGDLLRAQRAQEAVAKRVQAAELAVAGLEREIRLAEDAAKLAAGRLADARAALADAQLEEGLAQADALLRTARNASEDAGRALARQDPEGIRLLRDNQEQVVERLGTELHGKERARDQAQGELRARASDGLEEEWQQALRSLERAERAHARLKRLAEAADLLYQTLKTHRERALRDYRSPYRRAIEEMGRIVFDASFAVELDDALAIARRTLHGETLDFAALSTGTREQLAVIARLAAARLSSSDGVPVVLDDAFGYSDRERLARIGAVLGALGPSLQVIVLTCVAERYQSVGSARLIDVRALDRGNEPGSSRREVAAARQATPDAAERVLACLRAAGRPLSKREILASSGLSEGDWTAVIGPLAASNRVERVGSGRGSTYRLAGTS